MISTIFVDASTNGLTSLDIGDVDPVWTWGTNVPPPRREVNILVKFFQVGKQKEKVKRDSNA